MFLENYTNNINMLKSLLENHKTLMRIRMNNLKLSYHDK